MSNWNDRHMPGDRDAKRVKADAVAAFDAMCAARPLKPPPMPKSIDTRTASELALAEDRRRGLLGREFRLEEIPE